MSEVAFAKSFLATIDKRSIKLPADHVADPRKYPSQSPYTLPRQTHPFPRKTVSAATQQAKGKTVTATLKPMRGGDAVTISDITLQSTIHDIKTQYAQKSEQPNDKIKLLLNKKPAADLKTLQELGINGGTVELSVMIMGGGGVTSPPSTTPVVEKTEPSLSANKMDLDEKTPAPASEKAQVEAEKKKKEALGDGPDAVLKTEEFWTDLKGFLSQRLRDESEAGRLAGLFREAYGNR